MPPPVSIVISNFNGTAYLRRCLDSLEALDYRPIEVVFVDAGSTDGSADLVEHEFPQVHLERRGMMGIGEAVNVGIATSCGELLLLDFNSDEIATPSLLNELVKALESSPDIGAVGGVRLLDSDRQTVDTMGGLILPFGYYPKLGSGRPRSTMPGSPQEVGYLPCMLVRRELVKRLQGFDESYYLYGEDPDFGARIWRAGYRVLLVPSAVTYHAVSGSGGNRSPRYVYYQSRSQIRLMLKSTPWPLLPLGVAWNALFGFLYLCLRAPPVRRLVKATRLGFLADRGSPEHVRAFASAVGWNVRHLADTLAARRGFMAIQPVRKERPGRGPMRPG